MSNRKKWLITAAVLTLSLVALLTFTTRVGREGQFIVGGALVNLGYRLQDSLESYDFGPGHEHSPRDVLEEFLHQNELASLVRDQFPRTDRHPLVALVVCMDARIDTNELLGDTRKYYYIIRTAGSVLSEREEEMLELAVDNGVKVVAFTSHTDCAAEGAAADPEKRRKYPALAQAIDERAARIEEFMERPAIAARIKRGELLVKRLRVNTANVHLDPAE